MSEGLVLKITCAKHKVQQQSQAETNKHEYDLAYIICQIWLNSTELNMINLL